MLWRPPLGLSPPRLDCKTRSSRLDTTLRQSDELLPLPTRPGFPLSADLDIFQDVYGPRIEEVVTKADKAGVFDANVEDSIPSADFGKGHSRIFVRPPEGCAAIRVADAAECPDFAPESPMSCVLSRAACQLR